MRHNLGQILESTALALHFAYAFNDPGLDVHQLHTHYIRTAERADTAEDHLVGIQNPAQRSGGRRVRSIRVLEILLFDDLLHVICCHHLKVCAENAVLYLRVLFAEKVSIVCTIVYVALCISLAKCNRRANRETNILLLGEVLTKTALHANHSHDRTRMRKES